MAVFTKEYRATLKREVKPPFLLLDYRLLIVMIPTMIDCRSTNQGNYAGFVRY